MMGRTHIAIGMATGLSIAYVLESGLPQIIILTGCTGVAAMLPDIDHPNSTLRDFMGLPGDLAFSGLPHRGITHTFLALAVVTAITYLILPPIVGFSMFLGYFSHLLADVVTPAGLPWLLPFSDKKWHLLPEPFRIRVNSFVERVIYHMTILISIGIVMGFIVRAVVSLF